MAMVPLSKKSSSVYHCVVMLIKSIFYDAEGNHIIKDNPAKKLSSKGGIPSKEREALSDELVGILLDAVRGLPPYVFIMLGLYAVLRSIISSLSATL